MDKIDRLLDAMEHPDSYSLPEIEAMLKDPEVKEVFDLLDKTKSSLQTITTPDIEDEWKRLEENHRNRCKLKRNWLTGLFSRNAAASIAIAIASLTAVGAFVGVSLHRNNNNRNVIEPEVSQLTEKVSVVSQPDSLEKVEEKEKASPETVVFDNETLETILTGIARYYDCKVVFMKESSKSLRLHFRWNQALTLGEVVERLNNFEQILLTINDRTIKVD